MKRKIIIVTVSSGKLTKGNVNSEKFINGKLKKKYFHRGNAWSYPFSKHLAKYSSIYDIECWNVYCPKEYEDMGQYSKIENGVTFTQFPATKIGSTYVSIALLKELRKRIKSKEKILVHLQTVHKVMAYLIAKQCKNIPIVAQQRGGNFPPLWSYRFTGKRRHLLLNFFYNLAINDFDYIFSSSLGGNISLLRKLKKKKVMHLKGGGFDFEGYVPRPKKEVRKELGLPIDKKILIHVGRFHRLKGIDLMVDLFNKLKTKRNDVEMLFVGGNESEPLYSSIADSGSIIVEYKPRDEVIKYINASDIHLLTSESSMWIPFGDIPTSLVESLSMNQPVVSPLLIHFMGSAKERKKLGILPKSYSNPLEYRKEILEAVEYILDNPEEFKNTRDIMKKYYTWENIIENNMRVYNKLFNTYFGDRKV